MDRFIYIDDYIVSDNLDSNHKSYIYGEVDERDIYNIIKNFDNVNSVLDVGSGCGKLIVYLSPYYDNVDGIEICEKRYNRSIELANKHNVYNVDIMLGDYKHLYFGNYNLIYCCNKVFEKEDNKMLYTKILNEFTGYCILFDYDHMLKHYLISTHVVRTSWNKKETIYLFMM